MPLIINNIGIGLRPCRDGANSLITTPENAAISLLNHVTRLPQHRRPTVSNMRLNREDLHRRRFWRRLFQLARLEGTRMQAPENTKPRRIPHD